MKRARSANKKAKSTVRLKIKGELISVNDATDDSGAELSAVGRRIGTKLRSRGIKLELKNLPEPVCPLEEAQSFLTQS